MTCLSVRLLLWGSEDGLQIEGGSIISTRIWLPDSEYGITNTGNFATITILMKPSAGELSMDLWIDATLEPLYKHIEER